VCYWNAVWGDVPFPPANNNVKIWYQDVYRKEEKMYVCGGEEGKGGRAKRKLRTGVSWGKLKERGHLENLGVDVKMII
jgi:hypothetical protein